MDVLLWIGWACTLVVLAFLVLIGLFGSLAFKAPSWDLEFLVLAHDEWRRRGLPDRNHSLSAELSMRRFVGQKHSAEGLDMQLRARTISTIAVLVGADDRDSLELRLNQRGDALLLSGLTGVSNSVRNISNLNVASRVWAVRRWTALSVVLWRGLAWFLPRCFRQVAKVIEHYMAVATILGIAGGLLYWGFSSDVTESSGSGIAWVNFVGVVVTAGTVVALVLAVGEQFLLVAVSVVGPVRTWTRKGLMTAVLVLGFAIGMLTLVRSGAWTQWQLDAIKFFTELTNTSFGDWLGGILLVAIIVFAIHRALRWALARQLRTGDRVTALGAAIVLTLLGVVVILFILDTPQEVALPATYVTASALASFGLLDTIFTVAEWIGKYRALRTAGVAIRRGWFRWWILWTWSGTAFTLVVLASIPPLSYLALSGTPFYLPVTIVTMLAAFAVLLALLPGVFTLVRFVIRVHNTYARHEFDLARTRYDATGEAGAWERRATEQLKP